MAIEFKNKNPEKGVTLIEIIIAIVIMTTFSLIVIADFPKIKRQFAVSRAVYKVAQDIRKTEDLGFSGVQITDGDSEVVETDGYGFYINTAESDVIYIIYADTDGGGGQNYSGGVSCDDEAGIGDGEDCIVEQINMQDSESEVYIKGVYGTDENGNESEIYGGSINFMPPNPTVLITSISNAEQKSMRIVLGIRSEPSMERSIYINSTGLVYVE